MAVLYAESSAVLAWILGEERGGIVERLLARAPRVVCSELTLVECDRSLHRCAATGRHPEGETAAMRAVLVPAVVHWSRVRIGGHVLARARRRFPYEPVRSLDALHLATAAHLRDLGADLQVLSLDHRVRENAEALGFDVLPGGR